MPMQRQAHPDARTLRNDVYYEEDDAIITARNCLRINDGAKGFLVGISQGPVIFSATGIVVRRPEVAQLLAMKLSAWRDDVDIEDARRLLGELRASRDDIWQAVEPFLIPGQQLKAKYAFLDLWETTYGTD